MSIKEANKSRFERGLMKLTELEGELLEALENCKGFMDNPIMRRRHGDEWLYKAAINELAVALDSSYGLVHD